MFTCGRFVVDCSVTAVKCKNPHACCRTPRLEQDFGPNVLPHWLFLKPNHKHPQEEVGVLPLYFPFLFNPLLALAQKLPCVTPALWRVHILPVGSGIHTVQHTLYHPIQSQHMGG